MYPQIVQVSQDNPDLRQKGGNLQSGKKKEIRKVYINYKTVAAQRPKDRKPIVCEG